MIRPLVLELGPRLWQKSGPAGDIRNS